MTTRTISQAAREAGVGVETIRYYQRIGLMAPPAKPAGGGYRRYRDADLARLRFIREGQQLGFTLKEIRQLILLADTADCDCEGVNRLATAKRDQLAATLARVQRMHDALGGLIEACGGSGSLDVCSIWNGIGDCTSNSQPVTSGGRHGRKKKR